jgi:hypothetical protein
MRPKMIMTYIMACALGLITTGCSTFSKDPNKTVEIPKEKMAEVPAWFIAKDADDKNFIVVTATDISKDLQFAIDKATLNAKIQLAERLKSDVNSLVRESTLETGGGGTGSVEREVDRVSKVHVKQTIGFFKRENVAVFREGDGYRAYVMLKIAVDDARRLTRPDAGQTREDRFKELEQSEGTAVVTPVSSIQLLDVDNEEYKRRRDEALQKPGAVIGQITVR